MSSNTELLERIADALERIASIVEEESGEPEIKVVDTRSGLYITDPQEVKESDRYCKDV